MKKQAEIIKHISDKELLINLYATQLIMFIIALFTSWLIKGDVFAVLNVFQLSGDHLLIGLTFGVAIVTFELFLSRILPPSWFDDGGINKRVFSSRHPFHIVVLSAIVAISEEVLFRGVIQTYAGLWVASILFTLIHFRYLANRFLFIFTILLSVSLGVLFELTGNLLTAIVAHFIIDCLLGLHIRYFDNKH
ncbi:CPBP family intramembrane metalloprotease [Bacillus sp. A301a_S52]|nr:CPBP family intramembrane metalloprotease [Bacillus sp. A301a_S52]